MDKKTVFQHLLHHFCLKSMIKNHFIALGGKAICGNFFSNTLAHELNYFSFKPISLYFQTNCRLNLLESLWSLTTRVFFRLNEIHEIIPKCQVNWRLLTSFGMKIFEDVYKPGRPRHLSIFKSFFGLLFVYQLLH